jgi:hypothetical protein
VFFTCNIVVQSSKLLAAVKTFDRPCRALRPVAEPNYPHDMLQACLQTNDISFSYNAANSWLFQSCDSA